MKMITLFSRQGNAYKFETQFGAAVAGVQSGKTFLGSLWALKKIGEFSDKNGIIVAPTYKILQAATLKKFFDLAPEYRRYYKEQKGQIELPTGGVIYIRSADNPLGIEGITAHWIWLDEGGQCSVLTWTVLRSRVSLTGGQILITTTPYNMGWLYKDFYKPWKNGTDKQLSFYTWRSIDNPYFNKEFYEAEQKRLSVQEFARRYMGEFQKMSGLIWDLPQEQIIAPLEKNTKTEARIMGLDWGFRNPAGIAAVYFKDNAFYIVDEWKKAERTPEEIIQAAKNMVKEHRITKVYPDPEEAGIIEQYRNVLPMYEANKEVFAGLSHIQTLIKEKRLFVCNNCVETIDEMSIYHWVEQRATDEGKDFKEEPEKVNDHLCDALRYAIHSYQPLSKQEYKASEPLLPYYSDLGF